MNDSSSFVVDQQRYTEHPFRANVCVPLLQQLDDCEESS